MKEGTREGRRERENDRVGSEREGEGRMREGETEWVREAETE